MSINISELKIILDINVPGFKKTTFTRKMLTIPNLESSTIELSDMPFITDDVLYDEDALNLMSKTQQLTFFFNRDVQTTEVLKIFSRKAGAIIEGKERERTLSSNVMIMLRILFPTKYPEEGNIKNSYNYGLGFNLDLSLPVKSWKYSYIKLNNQIYTCKQLIWLNDILNHPEFFTLVQRYIELRNWADRELKLVKPFFNAANIEKLFTTSSRMLHGLKRPPAYHRFIDNVKRLNSLYRESGNSDLSDMLRYSIINNEQATKLFDFLQTIYRHYFLKEDVNLTSDVKKLLNLGVCTIDRSTPRSRYGRYDFDARYDPRNRYGPRYRNEKEDEYGEEDIIGSKSRYNSKSSYRKPSIREIYVMVDVFKGEITDKTVSEISCKYTGEELGTRLVKLVENDPTPWKVGMSRPLYALNDLMSTTGNVNVPKADKTRDARKLRYKTGGGNRVTRRNKHKI